ncbi:class II fructose-bisphosphate aldolase [Phnomibacter sp. MR]|uniref:class II fructose-bisphosphate aldolase n=1 Tax=Phnomibacter sp. MR TaxID=3042318 RepID=UPI003A7FB2D8
MKPVSTNTLFKHCYGRYAIAAVNVFNMEQVHALFAAAQACNAPIIVQLTPAARNFGHPEMLHAMVSAAADIYPDVVHAIHLDHGNEAHAASAIAAGYNAVMIDASHDPFEQNIARTKAVVELAHVHGIAVEAELGVLAGVEDDLSVDEAHAKYTDATQAKTFVAQTKCDSLAVAVGTSHGAYKFSGKQGLQFDVLRQIQVALPGFPLVLHGASLVDPAEVERINAHGGTLRQDASGVSVEALQRAIQLGVCKVNIATDLRLLWARVYREFFHTQPDQFDPVIPGKIYMEACRQLLTQRFEVLGASGKASDLKTMIA